MSTPTGVPEDPWQERVPPTLPHDLVDFLGQLACARCGRIWSRSAFLGPSSVDCDPVRGRGRLTANVRASTGFLRFPPKDIHDGVLDA